MWYKYAVKANQYDRTGKYILLNQINIVHECLGLEGEAIGLYANEIITDDGRNKRTDISYVTSLNQINNIEVQSGVTTEEKLHTMGEYRDILHCISKKQVNTIVLSRVNPDKCARVYPMSKTFKIEPDYYYISPEECEEKLINLENKVNNNKKLSRGECLEFAVLPIFIPDETMHRDIKRLCKTLSRYDKMDDELRPHITFALGIMIEYYFDEDEKEKLMEMIDMDNNIITIESLKNEIREEGRDDVIKAIFNPSNEGKTLDELKDVLIKANLM